MKPAAEPELSRLAGSNCELGSTCCTSSQTSDVRHCSVFFVVSCGHLPAGDCSVSSLGTSWDWTFSIQTEYFHTETTSHVFSREEQAVAVRFPLDKQNLSAQSNEQRTDFTPTAFLRCWWRPWWCRLWLTTTTSSFNVTVHPSSDSLPSLPSRLNTGWHHLTSCYQLRFQSWTSTDQSSNSVSVSAESNSPTVPSVPGGYYPSVSGGSSSAASGRMCWVRPRVQTVLQVDGGQWRGFQGRLGLVVVSAGVAKILGKHENKNSEQLSIFQSVCWSC